MILPSLCETAKSGVTEKLYLIFLCWCLMLVVRKQCHRWILSWDFSIAITISDRFMIIQIVYCWLKMWLWSNIFVEIFCIQALISGDIPGFIDVVMNFDSAELANDNLLYQLNASGKAAVFYGDDTWLKLFPRSFIRSEGTTSFFVSDYTEVRVYF